MVKLKVFSSRYDHAISLFLVWWRFYLGFIINGYSLLVQVGFKIQTTLTIFIFSIEFNFEKRLSSFYFYTLGICWENSNQRSSLCFLSLPSIQIMEKCIIMAGQKVYITEVYELPLQSVNRQTTLPGCFLLFHWSRFCNVDSVLNGNHFSS